MDVLKQNLELKQKGVISFNCKIFFYVNTEKTISMTSVDCFPQKVTACNMKQLSENTWNTQIIIYYIILYCIT